MKSPITTFALVLIITSSSLLFLPSQALFNKEMVVIRNDIPGEIITIGCYSKDDNLGVHTLSYGGGDFTFRFHEIYTTKFYCDFTTSHGSGNYGVYTSRLEILCNQYCLWLIKANGPCLVQVDDDNLYCQDWKVPPKAMVRGK